MTNSSNNNQMQSDSELMRVIGRIEGKIDGMMASMASLHTEHKELKVNYENLRLKVQSMENRMYLYAGAVAVISPVALVFAKNFIG